MEMTSTPASAMARDGVEIDAAGRLEDGLAGRQFDGLGIHVERKVIQQQDVRRVGQGLLQLGDRVDLDFDLHGVADSGLGAFHGFGDTAADGDMVILDQDGVVQAIAVVMSATALDGVLLQGAQIGEGLARARDLGVGAGDRSDIFRGQGGNARQMA